MTYGSRNIIKYLLHLTVESFKHSVVI